MKHLSEEQLILHLYGEGGDVPAIDAHLRACDVCGKQYAQLRRDLSVVEKQPVPDRGADYPARVWQAVEPRLQPRGRSWFGGGFGFARLALVGSVAALVIAAFLVGRWSDGPVANPVTPEARERILLVAVGDHLDRSQRLLIELINTGDLGATDISTQQASARDLALNNRLYRQTAGRAGRTEIVDLLEELESLLLEVANGPSEPAFAELAAIQRRIASRGLVMRIRLLGGRTKLDAAADGAAGLEL
jgi:hypothetical protein